MSARNLVYRLIVAHNTGQNIIDNLHFIFQLIVLSTGTETRQKVTCDARSTASCKKSWAIAEMAAHCASRIFAFEWRCLSFTQCFSVQ